MRTETKVVLVPADLPKLAELPPPLVIENVPANYKETAKLLALSLRQILLLELWASAVKKQYNIANDRE